MLRTIRKTVDEIREDYQVSDYEALDIAIKLKQLEAFERAHVLTSDNNVPAALESIAMQLGKR